MVVTHQMTHFYPLSDNSAQQIEFLINLTVDELCHESRSVLPLFGSSGCARDQSEVVVCVLVMVFRFDAVPGFTGGARTLKIISALALPIGAGI